METAVRVYGVIFVLRKTPPSAFLGCYRNSFAGRQLRLLLLLCVVHRIHLLRLDW